MSRTDPTLSPVTSAAALSSPPGTGMASRSAVPADRILIRNIDWKAYRQISDALGEHHHYRLSYDGKDLELMTKSMGHGMYGRFLCFVVVVLTETLQLSRRSCGDMTCDREDIAHGIEPDECFYIENEPRVRGKRDIDLAVDPAPDLGIEIDLTTDSRRRMGIYAAIRVPEIWRYEDRTKTVLIYVLQPDGQYATVERSRCLPLVGAADLTRFLQRQQDEEESSLLKEFRQWAEAEAKKQR
jgi:Uma2 family endonuclease